MCYEWPRGAVPLAATPPSGTLNRRKRISPVTAETLTSAWPDRQSVLQGGQEKEAALEAGYGMTDYV